MKADWTPDFDWRPPKSPQAASPRLLRIEGEAAEWAERVEAALGALLVLFAFVVVVFVFAALDYHP